MYVQYMYAIHVQMGVVGMLGQRNIPGMLKSALNLPSQMWEAKASADQVWRAWRLAQRSCVEVMCGDCVRRLSEGKVCGRWVQWICVVDVRGEWVQWICVEVVRGGCVWRLCEEVVRGGWVQRLGEEAHHQRLQADLFVIPNGWEQHEQVVHRS
jgi:hypothetical protein